jgi:Lsr2
MAQRVVTIVTDDLTGKESDEVATHVFSLDGVAYEIDLAPESYDQLLEALAPYTSSGRRAGKVASTSGRGRKVGRPKSGPDPVEVRRWAKDHGYDVNPRGRVPASIVRAYEHAH